MSNRVLVPMTHSDESRRALEFSVSNFPNAEIVVFHAINPTMYHVNYDTAGYIDEDILEKEREKAEQLLAEAETTASTKGAVISTEIRNGSASKAIIEYATEEEIDQIVMGSRGRSGISRLLLGSVAESVVRRSPVPVTIVK